MISLMRKRNLDVSFQWRGKPCPVNRNTFALESYAVDEVTDQLYIFPEVPTGKEVYALVECAVRPTQETQEVSDEFAPMLREWALWKAKSMDMEISSAAGAAAQVHYKAFFDMLSIKPEKDFRSNK